MPLLRSATPCVVSYARSMGAAPWSFWGQHVAGSVTTDSSETATVRTRAVPWGLYHGGRRPSSDDNFHSPSVILPSALHKPSIMKLYYLQRTTRWGVTARSPTMATLHDTRFVECRWWNDGWTAKTVVTWLWSASMIPAPGHFADSMWPGESHHWVAPESFRRV